MHTFVYLALLFQLSLPNCGLATAPTPADVNRVPLSYTYPQTWPELASSAHTAADTPPKVTPISYAETPTQTTTKPSRKTVDHLTVKIDPTHTNFTVNWTHIMQYVSLTELETIWNETDVSEPLMATLTRYSLVYKVDKNATYIPGNGSTPMCPPFHGHEKINFTTGMFPTSFKSFHHGHVGIRADQLLAQMFFYLSYVFKHDSITHNVFYSARSNIIYVSVSFLRGNYQLLGIITKYYMYTTLIREETSKIQHTLTMMFGENNKLPSVKGYMTREEMTVARNDRFSLLVISTYEDYAHIYNYFQPTWSNVFKSVTELSVRKLAVRLQEYLIMFIKNGGCEELRMDTDFITFFFEFIALYYRFASDVEAMKTNYLDFDCLINTLFEVEIVTNLMEVCFTSFYRRGFVSNGISRTAASLIGKMPLNGHEFEITDKEWFLKSLYFADFVPYILSKSLYGITKIVLHIYTNYVNDFSIIYSDRKLLFYIYLAMSNFELNNSTSSDPNLMLLYRLTTSMCSASEISHNVEFWAKPHDLDVYNSFSPCYMSLRFDYTKEKLAIESMQELSLSERQKKEGISVLFDMLHGQYNRVAMDNLVIRKCITDPSKVMLIIPFETCTYVISREIVAFGRTFDVSDTFLKSNMVVTVVANDRCIYDKIAKTTNKIPIIYNITRPHKHCVMCQSAILSYDEYDGIEATAFISSLTVQNHIFSDHSSFFDPQNMHTHYLLLMNNGSVIEIKGFYKGRAMNMLIVLLFFIAFCAAMFLVYKIMYKLLY